MTKNISRLILPALYLLGMSAVWATTPADIKAAIEARYQVTTRNALGSVKAPGSVLVVQKEGLRANPPSFMMRPSVVKVGQLISVGGGGALLGGNKGHSLKVGDRVLLYGVKPAAGYVVLLIATVDTFEVVKNGSSSSVPYEGAISFQYEGGLAAVSVDDVLADISAWLRTEQESATASTKTISLGQTPEEVIAIMGAPEKKIELGQKVIYTYKDLKVIFVGGKVSDVQ